MNSGIDLALGLSMLSALRRVLFFASFMGLPMSLTWVSSAYAITGGVVEITCEQFLERIWGRLNEKRDQLTETERVELAKEAAAVQSRGSATTYWMDDSLKEYRITDQKSLVEIALVAASSQNLYNIKNWGIHREEDRITIARAVIAIRPDLFAISIKDYNIQDPEIRFELAKAMMESRGEDDRSISNHIINFDIVSEDQRFELAELEARNYPDLFIKHVLNFKINNRDKLWKLIKDTLPKRKYTMNAEHLIEPLNLNESERIELAKGMAALNVSDRAHRYALNIRPYHIQDEQARFEIASIDALNTIEFPIKDYNLTKAHRIKIAKKVLAHWFRIFRFDDYKIQDQAALFELASMVAANSNDHLDFNIFGDYPIKDSRKRIEIVMLSARKLQRLPAYYFGLAGFPIEDVSNIENLSLILKATNYEAFIPLLTDSSKHFEVQKQLLLHLFELLYISEKKEKNLTRLAARPHSLNLLEILMGQKEQSLDGWKKFSNDRKSTVYELTLEILEKNPSLFARIPDAARFLTNKDSVVRILNLIRDTLALMAGNELNGAESIARAFKASQTPDDLEIHLKEAYVELVKELFEQPDLNFTFEDLLKLKEKWGDIDPVLTLLSRFRGQSEWHNEIPILTRIFQSVLANDFSNLKFHQGFDETDHGKLQEQTAMLSTKKLAMWKKPQVLAKVSGGESSVSEGKKRQAVLKKQMEHVIQTNLVPHLQEQFEWPDTRPLVLPIRGESLSLTAQLQEKRPEETWADLYKKGRRTKGDHALIKELIEYFSSDRDEFIAGLEYLRANIHDLIRDLGQRHQLANDVQDILDLHLQLTKKDLDDKPKSKQILFTTTLSDAKSLLMVGDLVEASSCQNYKTGSVIQTLLGYVLDANVQAVVSYALSSGDFNNDKDFKAAIAAVEQDPKSISFDSYQQVFMVRVEGATVVSRPVKKAYRRQILKLGKTEDGSPGLKLERAYMQNHHLQWLMEEEMLEIYHQIAKDLGAKEGSIHISRSRNPGGVYSDAASGVKTGAYEIH